MNEEAQKKLYLWILIIVAVLGLFFVIWAFFLNKGTLTISGNAPFNLNIQGLRTESCLESPCSLEIAPGQYTVSVQKTGYRTIEIDVDVPIGGEHIEEVDLKFIPTITRIGLEADVQAFPELELIVPELEDTPLFFEENYITYLAYDEETNRQTLYLRGITDDDLSEPQVATSFIRTIDEYTIVPDIEGNNSIVLIDQTDAEEDALYLVDLTEKSRDNIFSLPYIANAKWLGSGNLLIEGREEGEVNSSIFFYSAEEDEAEKLNLQTTLDNVTLLNETTLIAATSQPFTGASAGLDALGALITLQELSATPNLLIPGSATPDIETGSRNGPQLAFIHYDLTQNQARLLAVDIEHATADKIKLGRDQKTVQFLVGAEVYELRFED